MGDSAPGSSSNATARLKMALSRLPDDIIDGDRQEIQTQAGEMAWRMRGDSHPAPA
ncbi:hypothetical protein [Janthinobacterium violaceinigrum]|uniref:hypothetical protein n=1 Tax=Janthinobacterium violaceinigrum TaxID=2654252 RepID=UPI00186B2793|nr:hypothetical protein [Janthinobacterium violaceinigrum]